MLYYDIIDIFEGIDVNKTSALKKCNVCHYWYLGLNQMHVANAMIY